MKTMNNSNKIVAKYVIIFAMMLSLSASTFAQTYTIKGKIVDQNTNENLMFVNCVLYNAKDTLKQISGVAADTNGVFQFKNIKKQDLLLTLTFVGYEKKVIEIKSSSFKGNIIDLGTI
ncbi:MAG: carboxypeptidase-like regulatory domain-containing protein [Bacteroidales bacterium]|nr:carboxypeptidase-like regulatory domain-containing protein [Bacteroidales bacterium]